MSIDQDAKANARGSLAPGLGGLECRVRLGGMDVRLSNLSASDSVPGSWALAIW